MTFPSTHANLAEAYVGLGQADKAVQVLQDYLRRSPESFTAYWSLGYVTSSLGRFDEAASAFAKAEALRPTVLHPSWGRWRLNVLRDEWSQGDLASRTMTESTDSFWRYVGNLGLAMDALYRGRANEARRFLERAASVDGPKGSNQTAFARDWSAALSLDLGQPAVALADTEHALKDADGRSAQWPAWHCLALAHHRLGHAKEATHATEELTRRAGALPGDREQRSVHLLAGAIALDRRDWRTAIEELKKAAAMLPPNAVDVPPVSLNKHVSIRFTLGRAYLESGDDSTASTEFESVINAGILRVYHPIEFVRSLYYLGQINDRQGNRDKSRAFYRRFLEYWGDGDIDRERIVDARKKLAGSS
jgi:tetratricopeptide (TPR) repeat protein